MREVGAPIAGQRAEQPIGARRGLAQALELGLEEPGLGDGVNGLCGRAGVVLCDLGLGLRVAQAFHHGDGHRLQRAGARRVPDFRIGEDFVGVIAERAHREGDHDTVGCDVAAELRGARGRKTRRRPGTEHERVGAERGHDGRGGHRRERGGGESALSGGGKNAALQGPCGGAKPIVAQSCVPGHTEFAQAECREATFGTPAGTGNGEGPGWTGAGD